MAITAPPEITAYPEAPRRGQPESVFIPTANTFVASLEPRRVEMQALADWMKSVADYIDTKIIDNKTAIDSVYASIDNVDTVSDSIANVNTTADNIADVNTTAVNIADVNKVADIDGDVSTVAASDLAVNTVATDVANVNTAAGSIANVNTVAADIDSVNTAADNIADVNAVAADILAVQAAAALSKRQALYARSVSENPPIGPETLRLDYANRAYGIGDAATGLIDDVVAFDTAHTFTRGSAKRAPNALGVLTEYGVDEPAYTYDPATGKALGLLIEEQRTNLLLWSEAFDNTEVVKENCTIDPNAAISPDGTLNADKLVSSAVNENQNLRYGRQGIGESWSIFAKFAGIRYLAFTFYNNAGANAVFDLVNGVISDPPYDTGWSASMVPVGNGWYRCIVNADGDNYNFCRIALNDTGSASASATPPALTTGDDTSGIYIWGAQLEEASFPTSYIKTEGSQVTRSADNCSRTLGAEMDNYAYTIYLEGVSDFGPDREGDIFNTGGGTEYLRISISGTGSRESQLITLFRRGTQYGLSSGTSAIPPGTKYRIALAVDEENKTVTLALNGEVVDSLIYDIEPPRISARSVDYSNPNTTKKLDLIYSRALTATELEALTAP